MIKRIESQALAESDDWAPLEVVRHLARDDDAVPLLAASVLLSERDLIEIASTKRQAHLLAISMRPQIALSSPTSCCSTDTKICFAHLPRIRALNSLRAASRRWCATPKATHRLPKKSGFGSTCRWLSGNCAGDACDEPAPLEAISHSFRNR